MTHAREAADIESHFAKLIGAVSCYIAADPQCRGEAFRDMAETVDWIQGKRDDLLGWPKCFEREKNRADDLEKHLAACRAALHEITTACPPFGNGLPGISAEAAAAYRKCEAIAAKAIAEIEAGGVPAVVAVEDVEAAHQDTLRLLTAAEAAWQDLDAKMQAKEIALTAAASEVTRLREALGKIMDEMVAVFGADVHELSQVYILAAEALTPPTPPAQGEVK